MSIISIAFIAISIILFTLVSFQNKKISLKTIVLIMLPFLVGLVIYGYNFQPIEADDLFRYYFEMNRYMTQNFNEFYSNSTWSSTIISSAIMFLISKTGDINLLGGLTIVLYFLTFLIVVLILGKGKKSSRGIFFIFLFFISNLYIYEFISITRFSMGIFFITLVIYLDFFKLENKYIVLLLYFVSFFIHTSLIAFLGIRLIFMIKNNVVKYSFLIMTPFIIKGLSSLLTLTQIPFLVDLAIKIAATSTTSALFTSWIRIVIYLMIILLILVVIIGYTRVTKTQKIKNNNISYKYINYCRFLLALIVFLLTTPFWMQLAFHRFIQVIIVLSLPIFYNYFFHTRRSALKYVLFSITIAISISNIIYQLLLYV